LPNNWRREQKGNRRKKKGKKKGIGGNILMGRGIDGSATLNNNSACRTTMKFMFMTSKNLEDRGSSFLRNTDTPNKVHVVTFQNIIIVILNAVKTKKVLKQVACSVYILRQMNAECAVSKKMP
jgi:predicted protein tyrosine phosphatase